MKPLKITPYNERAGAYAAHDSRELARAVNAVRFGKRVAPERVREPAWDRSGRRA